MKTYLLCLLALTCALTHVGAQPESTFDWNGDEAKLFAHLKDDLHMPEHMRLALMFARDKQEIEARRIGLIHPEGMTRWSGSPQSPYLAKLNDIYDERRIKLRAIMGNELDLTLVKNDSVTAFKWDVAHWTDTEIVNVKRIHERYDSIVAHNHPFRGILDKANFDWDCQYEAAFEKEIQHALGPKADDFLTFCSPVAKSLEDELAGSGVEVDETTFRQLLTETRALRAELAGVIQTMPPKTARLKQVQMYQVVLGSDKALAIAIREDLTFRRFNSIADGEPGVRLQFYFDWLESQNRMAAIPVADPFNPGPEAVALMNVEAAKLVELLKANVPADRLEAFSQTREGRFLKRAQLNP